MDTYFCSRAEQQPCPQRILSPASHIHPPQSKNSPACLGSDIDGYRCPLPRKNHVFAPISGAASPFKHEFPCQYVSITIIAFAMCNLHLLKTLAVRSSCIVGNAPASPLSARGLQVHNASNPPRCSGDIPSTCEACGTLHRLGFTTVLVLGGFGFHDRCCHVG